MRSNNNNIITDLLDNIRCLLRRTRKPRLNIKVRRPVQRDRVTLERIHDDGKVAIGRELIGYELNIDELVANHIRDDDEAVFGGFALGIRYVHGGCMEAQVSTLGFDLKVHIKVIYSIYSCRYLSVRLRLLLRVSRQ